MWEKYLKMWCGMLLIFIVILIGLNGLMLLFDCFKEAVKM